MWWSPQVHDAAGLPEKRDNAWYRSPDGELRFVYLWEPDGLTVQIVPQTWVAVSSFYGWTLYKEPEWVKQKEWAEMYGWKWEGPE